jgi:DNA-binding protein HU-alpha
MEAAQSVILGPVMRKKELIDTVVEHSGMKKKDVKPVVESMLEVLGAALAEKRELNLQPLGRVKIRREKQLPNGRMLIAKIRQANPNNGKDTEPSDNT